MTERLTDYGWLKIGSQAELFAEVVALTSRQFMRSRAPAFTWALSGGSTPQAWYRWCVGRNVLPVALAGASHFTVSDERHVSLDSPQSNFGNAARLLLDPLGIPADQRHPWPVEQPPLQSAGSYCRNMESLTGPGRGFDMCLLGLGDDTHTASFFPGSPLLQDDGGQLFAAVPVADKGWRLTITPTGLRECGSIVVMALGAEKADALQQVFTAPYEPSARPAQILKTCADRVVWLVDETAAPKLPRV